MRLHKKCTFPKIRIGVDASVRVVWILSAEGKQHRSLMNGPTCIVPAWLPACWADILGYVVWCVPQWENDFFFFFFAPPACLQQQPPRAECRVASGCSQHSADELMVRAALCVCQWRTYTEATSSGARVGLLCARTHQECRSRDVFRSRTLNKGSSNAVVYVLRGLKPCLVLPSLNKAFTLPPPPFLTL